MDENGCTAASGAISIANHSALSVSVSGGQNGILDATCADSEDGVVVLITIGGSGTSAGMQFSTDGENFAAGNILNIGGGTYTFYAMDVNGCVGSTANEYTVGAPDPIVITGTAMASCATAIPTVQSLSVVREAMEASFSLSMEVRTAM